MLSAERIQELGALVKAQWPNFGTLKTPPSYSQYSQQNRSLLQFETKTFGWLPLECVDSFPGLRSIVACCGMSHIRLDGTTGFPESLPNLRNAGWTEQKVEQYYGKETPLPQMEVQYIQNILPGKVTRSKESLARFAAFALWLHDNAAPKRATIIASTASKEKIAWSDYERELLGVGFIPVSRNQNLNYTNGRYCTLWKMDMAPDVLGDMPEYKELLNKGLIPGPTPPPEQARKRTTRTSLARRVLSARKTAVL